MRASDIKVGKEYVVLNYADRHWNMLRAARSQHALNSNYGPYRMRCTGKANGGYVPMEKWHTDEQEWRSYGNVSTRKVQCEWEPFEVEHAMYQMEQAEKGQVQYEEADAHERSWNWMLPYLLAFKMFEDCEDDRETELKSTALIVGAKRISGIQFLIKWNANIVQYHGRTSTQTTLEVLDHLIQSVQDECQRQARLAVQMEQENFFGRGDDV